MLAWQPDIRGNEGPHYSSSTLAPLETRLQSFDLQQLALTYAITIHKSQGSDFPAVVVPVPNSHHIMLQRNLLYTAITRARQLVVLVGDPKAIAVVHNDKVLRRYTALAMRLGQAVQSLTWMIHPIEQSASDARSSQIRDRRLLRRSGRSSRFHDLAYAAGKLLRAVSL